jgi:hypothetical protein
MIVRIICLSTTPHLIQPFWASREATNPLKIGLFVNCLSFLVCLNQVWINHDRYRSTILNFEWMLVFLFRMSHQFISLKFLLIMIVIIARLLILRMVVLLCRRMPYLSRCSWIPSERFKSSSPDRSSIVYQRWNRVLRVICSNAGPWLIKGYTRIPAMMCDLTEFARSSVW